MEVTSGACRDDSLYLAPPPAFAGELFIILEVFLFQLAFTFLNRLFQEKLYLTIDTSHVFLSPCFQLIPELGIHAKEKCFTFGHMLGFKSKNT